MRDAEEYDVQPCEETEALFNDPTHQAWCAARDAETDHGRGMGLTAGLAAREYQTAEEKSGYVNSYNAEVFRAIGRAAGIPAFRNPYVYGEEIV